MGQPMSCCIEGHECEDCCLCGEYPARCETDGCDHKADVDVDGRLLCLDHEEV